MPGGVQQGGATASGCCVSERAVNVASIVPLRQLGRRVRHRAHAAASGQHEGARSGEAGASWRGGGGTATSVEDRREWESKGRGEHM